MIKFDFKCFFSNLCFALKDHFRECKKYYIVFAVLILIGLITGILTGFKKGSSLTIDSFNDKVLVDFLSGDLGIFAMLIRRLFSFCVLFFLLCLLNIKSFTVFANFVIVLYQAYILGVNSAIFISLFSISGIINVFVVYLPCRLLSLVVLTSLATILCSSCLKYRKFGETIMCHSFWQQKSRTLILLLVLSILVALFECILLPSLCSAFFIV